MAHRYAVYRAIALQSRRLNCRVLQGQSRVLQRGSQNSLHVKDALVSNRYTTLKCLHTTADLQGNVVQFKLSDIGEGIREVIVKEWYVEVGDEVAQFDSMCEVQSDKASVTITSRYDGIIKKIYYAVDDTALVGQPLVDIQQTDAAFAEVGSESLEDHSDVPLTPPSPPSAPKSSSGKALATPAVRRIAMENKVDLEDVVGMGKDGRVMKEDILAFLSDLKEPSLEVKSKPLRPKPIQLQEMEGQKLSPAATTTTTTKTVTVAEDQVVPVRGIQAAMSRAMAKALLIPHFGYCDEIDMSELVRLKDELRDVAGQRGVKFSYLPVILKAASLALKQFPMLNAHVNEDCTATTYKASHNLGVAMDTPDGLLVPNVKDVQEKSVFEVAADINLLQQAGLQGKLRTQDITGGTLSFSNIGSIGGTYAKPVILSPEVAISAIGKIQRVPRFAKDGSISEAHIMNISWSADHRVLDGATVCRFSNLMKMYLENPATMILDLK